MKKTVSLILALTLALALAIPASAAAEVKSDLHTYTLSNEVLGTTTFQFDDSDEDGEVYTVYLVPVGTVVTNNDLYLSYSIFYSNTATGEIGGGPGESVQSLTIETVDTWEEMDNSEGIYSDLIFCVGTLSAELQELGGEVLAAPEDAVFLKAVDPAEVAEQEPETTEPEATEPETTETAPAKKPVVIPTNQKLTVNGEAKETEIYNIDDFNYFKLRDIAALLTGTGSQFSVAFDSERNTIVVKTGEAYEVQEGDLVLGTDKSATTVVSAQSIEIDGEKVELTAYNIGGNNFFKLRDLGAALGFSVEYDEATATMVVESIESAEGE